MNEGKGRRKRRSAFVAARKQIRRGEAEEGGKERERVDKGAAGNKRLANPSCQFNLASNPGEMLIRASLPFLPSLLAALYPRAPFASLSLARASASASARAEHEKKGMKRRRPASPPLLRINLRSAPTPVGFTAVPRKPTPRNTHC